MQNEPNFNLNEPTIYANTADFTPNFCLKMQIKRALLHLFTRKKRAFRHVLQTFDTNILNSMYNKDLQSFSTENTINKWRETRNENMQNKPNFNPTPSWPPSPNGPRVTGDESRINMQNEPNSHTNSHKCLSNMDLRKYLHPALLVSTNIVDPPQEESIIN
jgi:hypothetical protein